MSLAWYLKRIRTFSVPEVLYRMSQQMRLRVLDRFAFCKRRKFVSAERKSEIIENSEAHRPYPIFGCSVDIEKTLDWHLDVSSGSRFPLVFAHKIDIRSDEFGSAKYVWEVNRLQFLVPLSLRYQETRDVRYLDLVLFHIDNWIRGNPYLCGVNWYSNIEVNIRLINWAYCWKILDIPKLRSENAAVDSFVRNVWMPSIREHVEYSHRHPSKYSSANNHLISEYAGQFIACCTWKDLSHSEKRLAYARRGLEREILLQNSPEGVNREEAAEYIQFVNDFFLIAAIFGKNADREFSQAYLSRLHKMAHYLNNLVDMCGNYPMYGDGDDGFVLRLNLAGRFNNFLSLLSSFAAFFDDASLKRSDANWDEKCELLLGEGFRERFLALPCDGDIANLKICADGHFVFRKRKDDKEVFLYFDAAPLGYLGIAAHGHADALSFMLHVDGRPIFADSGTFTYHTQREWRAYFAGTLAHNTARIDGVDQATLAGPTMWLNHYRCKILKKENSCISAEHDGYKKLGVLHRRTVRFDEERESFEILDEFLSENPFTLELPFHLHPDVAVKRDGNGFALKVPGIRLVRWIPDEEFSYREVHGEMEPILGWYSEHFGEKVPTTVLYAQKRCKGNCSFTTKIQVMER